MKEVSFRANSTEVNKSPDRVRYIFIIEHKVKDIASTIGTVTTYRTMLTCLDDKPRSEVDTYYSVVDLKEFIVTPIKSELIRELMEEWRINYFNYDWDIPTKYIC